MTSKKQPSTKRSALPRTSDYTKTFLKDWEHLSRSGRFDMHRLKEVMLLLVANDGPLGAVWSDHPLKGNKAAYRECHVGGDFLLMYCIGIREENADFGEPGIDENRHQLPIQVGPLASTLQGPIPQPRHLGPEGSYGLTVQMGSSQRWGPWRDMNISSCGHGA